MNVRLAPEPASNEDWVGQQDHHHHQQQQQPPYGPFHQGRFYGLDHPGPLRPAGIRERLRDHPRIIGNLYEENLAESTARMSFQCGQSRGQCQRPVDVEDLGLCFDQDRSQSGCSTARSSFRPQPKVTGPCYRTCPVEVDCQDWYGGTGQGCDGCPSGTVALCTEEQWLQCPVSDRCPVYQPTEGRDSLPPCLYDRYIHGEYLVNCWPFVYPEDDQLLEDYLSNEKRKERSRDAARCRRSRETDIFTELAAALPVPQDQAAHLDKASVMRLAIAYLKVRSVVDSVAAPLAKTEAATGDDRADRLFPKALNGFILVLSGDGNMVYLSENVSDYLGVSQMDMMGQSVYEYSHPCDHDEIRECLTAKPQEEAEKRPCSFFLRLKCTLTSKGRKVNLKSASYKVIHCVGRLTRIRDTNSNTMQLEDEEDETEKGDDAAGEQDTGVSLVLVGCPIPHPSNIEIPLGRHTFLSKHSLSMKFTYADEKLAEYLGWNSEELMGQSVFEFYHALDNLALDKSFKSLFSKGQCETVAYRFLGKRGGYAWVVTQATLIHCAKQQKPLSVVCVNYILSGVECEDEVYSVRQLAARENVASDPVKSEEAAPEACCQPGALEPTTELRLQVQINNVIGNSNSSCSGTELEEPRAVDSFEPANKKQENESRPKEATSGRPKPLAVTASTFRPAVHEPRRQPALKAQDGSRKDNTFPRPVHVAEKTFNGVPATGKQQQQQQQQQKLEDCQKENDAPENARQDRRQPTVRPPFVFQGKPALELDQVRRDRPQAVTRQLFTPLSAVQQQQLQQEQITCRPPPQTATASIFAPRTEDMNKGFLTFSEDQPGLTMLKDEPEDLTHLAPTPGDVCVPLEDTLFISDMLDEFILGTDNYCPLLSPGGALPPELRSADFSDPLGPQDTARKNFGDSLADSDPFMYGDSPASPCSIDPGSTVSPSLPKYQQSPERSMDSLSSPTGDSGGDGLSEDEMLMFGISDSIADDELELRAPYIPMSDQDEALDLLISDDMVMWGPSQNDKASPKWFSDEREQRSTEPSLPQLLRTVEQQQQSVASKRFNDHGGGLVNPAQVLGQIPRKGTTISDHWSTSKPDRPSKRIHTASMDTENENKRIKCDQSDENGGRTLDNGLLFAKYRPGRRSPSLGGSQLLRRLVSQQTGGARPGSNYTTGDLEEVSVGEGGRGSSSQGGRFLLHGRIDDTERDAGGGGGGGEGKQEDSSSRRSNPPCGSVLMNLLVSGCDDSLMDSRNVPTLKTSQSSLQCPLTVSLDSNQTVPQCPGSNETGPISFEQLTTDKIIAFDGFDYPDPVATVGSGGLLQVNSDLFGSLLDRGLV